MADLASLPNVSHGSPSRAEHHKGIMTGPYEIARFLVNSDGQDDEPPTVYVDNSGLYLDKPAEVERYSQAFEAIRTAALDTYIRASAKDLPGSRQ